METEDPMEQEERRPIQQDYTFKQMKDFALNSKRWEHSVCRSYETKLNERESLILSPRPRTIGTSSYETSHTPFNRWRNDFLTKYPIFGEKHMLHIEVISIGAETGARAFTLDQQLIDLYDRIHADLKGKPTSAVFEIP